jgi:hypothetical protein
MAASQLNTMELFDETLDINATENYDLTLELSEDGIALSVLDLLRGKYVLLRFYPLCLSESSSRRTYDDIITADDFLKKHYRKIYIITPSQQFVLVPAPVYDPDLKDEYFRFSHNIPAEATVIANTLPFPGATLLFTPRIEAMTAVSSYWPTITPWHHTKPLLHHISAACRSSEERYIHLHFEKSFITLFITENRNLTFCNSFTCPDATDASYYLFNVLDSRGIKPEEAIYLSGSIEPNSEAHLSILNFAENIRFSSPLIRQSFSYVMHDIAQHRWLNLFTAPSCE